MLLPLVQFLWRIPVGTIILNVVRFRRQAATGDRARRPVRRVQRNSARRRATLARCGARRRVYNFAVAATCGARHIISARFTELLPPPCSVASIFLGNVFWVCCHRHAATTESSHPSVLTMAYKLQSIAAALI
eukprot:6206807-Pleurochrysis_carterae.AAC.2